MEEEQRKQRREKGNEIRVSWFLSESEEQRGKHTPTKYKSHNIHNIYWVSTQHIADITLGDEVFHVN